MTSANDRDALQAIADDLNREGDGGMDCDACGAALDAGHHSSEMALCVECWEHLRARRRAAIAADGVGREG